MHKNPRAKAWESTVRKSQLPQHHNRRRGLNFHSMSVVPTTDDEETDRVDRSPTATTSEKFLPNGDFYTGEWHNNVPHGIGKYLWLDGCMYEGEWRNGKTMGKGKFSWPSGATYEGDFKLGFMNGYGTYIGSNGDAYKGGWSMNSKNGKGRKNYANGDWYEGEWKIGVQDGHGKYVWKNGNEYDGEWKNGVIHGKGSFIWANGNRYDGGWEDGMPMGDGSFRWSDGALYVGVWGKGGDDDQKGVYYPSSVASSPTARDPHAMFNLELAGCKVCPGEMVSILPSQKKLNLVKGGPDAPRPRRKGSIDMGFARVMRPNGGLRTNTVKACNGGESGFDGICIWESNGDITCDIVDGSRTMMSRSSTDSSISEESRLLWSEQQPMRTLPNATKKQGEIIKKGHKNYELMLNLQLGIRHAVGRQAAQAATLDLKSSAFDPKEKVWTKFPPEGSKYTPPHQSCEFRWKDYCPVVFRTLRRLFKVDAADYMLSICGDNALRELSSPGKSGSFFYLTNDDKYMIKTLKKTEVKVLLRMLPAYYNHVRSYENTLLTKFFGLHCVKLTGSAQKKVRFVIMGNLFCSQYIIHRRFDLKGSSHGRTTNKPESEIDANTTLKDLDLSYIFRLHKSWFQEFCRQVDKDCDLLEQERIMDYSLLVGLHFREARDKTSNEGNIDTKNSKETAPPRVDMDQLLSNPTRLSGLKLGINMPARVEKTIRINENELIGERTGNIYEAVLFFGIIDILQDYDISKKLEHAYKSFHYDATSISAVDPKLYSRRFKDFILNAFIEDT